MTRIKLKRIRFWFIDNQFLVVKGPLGKLFFKSSFLIIKKRLFFTSKAAANSFFSRARSLIKGLIYGFFIEIKTEGVGLKFFRYSKAPRFISFSFGFSHTIVYKMPKSIVFRCHKYRLILFSNRLTLLSLIAKRIRAYRPPDPYKSKGVKFASEALKLKPGKQRQR